MNIVVLDPSVPPPEPKTVPRKAKPVTVPGPEPLYYWRVRTVLPERHGQVLRVLARGRQNNALIEFVEDGAHYATSRWNMRRLRPEKVAEAAE